MKTEVDAVPAAESAMRLILGGREVEGLELYRRALAGTNRYGVLLGVHLAVLRANGRAAAAQLLERTGLLAGCDINPFANLPGKSPERCAMAYRRLFERDLVNSTMLAAYAEALSELDDAAGLADLMNAGRIRTHRVADLAPDGSGRPLHEAIAALLLAADGGAEWRDSVRSVRDMRYLSEPHAGDAPAMKLLAGLLRAAAARAFSALPGFREGADVGDGPSWAPRRWFLSSWALYSDGDGYNVPHFHPRGVLTGIYYVSVERGAAAALTAGALRLCPGANGRADCAGWPATVLAPTPGMLVIMPSYFTHCTEPIGRGGRRIALAFDIVPADPTDMGAERE